jgi:hypothetical protein
MEDEDEEILEEIERRLSAELKELGEEPWSDSDRAMYLRQDISVQVSQEFAERTNIDRMRDAVEKKDPA